MLVAADRLPVLVAADWSPVLVAADSSPVLVAADSSPVLVAADWLPVLVALLSSQFTLSRINLMPASISPFNPISNPIFILETETLLSSLSLSYFPLPWTSQYRLSLGG